MTLYLKYRPQKISELNLVSVRDQLAGIFKSGKETPHAFLFTGSRGTGKTSAARIVAKEVNGNNPHLNSQIELGNALDVIEIDAASNRGIDEIRDLREKIKLAPLEAKYKVYIIDEVHMLTNEAFNALLKTLEEPPAHAIFILCTTEAEKVPATIASRCTVVKFGRASIAEIVAKLNLVVREEKLKIDRGQLTMIAQAAKGSFRDAIKILEQVSLSGQSVAEVLGVTRAVDPAEFVSRVAAGDAPAALKMIGQLVDDGANLRSFIERCVERLRDQMLEGQSVLDLIAAFEKAYMQTRDSAVPQLPLEVLVIENSKKGSPEEKPDPDLVHREEALPVDLGDVSGVASKWTEVLKAVRPKNHSVEALLRSTRPVGWDGRRLTLEVFYKFHKDKLESDKCRQIVEEAVGTVMGMDQVLISLRLGSRSRPEEISAEAIEEDIVKAAEEIFKVDAI